MHGESISSKPSSVACIPCRRRHLKCDAMMPVCTRCQTTSTECQYVRSRRGFKKSTKNTPSDPVDEVSAVHSTEALPDWIQAVLSSEDSIDEIPNLDDNAIISLSLELVTPDVAYDPMIQLYYQNFHPSHPIMIPRKALNTQICYLIPSHLIAIMRYIGAHYYPEPSLKDTFRQTAFSSLNDPTLQAGFRVQALLLLAIVTHSHCDDETSHRLLQLAIDLALEIGMNTSNFASEHSYSHIVLKESWRRTYWELYVVDGLLSAFQEHSQFRLHRQQADVRLPCSEKMYTHDSVTLTEQTLNDMQSKIALGQNVSTFAHRINAVKTLGAVLDLNHSLEEDTESPAEILEAQITSSILALPHLHPDSHDTSSHDEMVFQAQMILYLALIHLHHPHSDIRFATFTRTPIPNSDSPFRDISTNSLVQTTQHTQNLHTHKLLHAANLLSALASLPSPIHRRTPFFTCALGMCVIVHVAGMIGVGSGSTSTSGQQGALKARITLSLGALKVLGRVWPLAGVVRGRVLGAWRVLGDV
ncbi:hypothetical protein BJY04DRAFT_207971 [Aspergillus karnatakaensis]|uniref:Zn(II)2Cys6 transcription factor n=1 Tax=Aspergillus karnatakaensis TaxID=1810916 RepID=UPI003CCD16FB